MSTKTHIFWLTLSVIGAYIWSSYPFLAKYSLQVFALSSVFYFVYKKITKPNSWNFLPKMASVEMIFVTFSLLTLLGSTGNLDSIFYPLTYIHLFFLVFFSHKWTSIIITCQIILFHYSLTPLNTNSQISHLVIIPIILVFFLFAKEKYQEAKNDKLIIEAEEEEIEKITAEKNELESELAEEIAEKQA